MTSTPARRKLGLLLALPATMALGVGVAVAQTSGTEVERPASFSSTFSVTATADQVPLDPDTDKRGNPLATGTYDLEIDAANDVICFDIAFEGVNEPFESPAPTANHIHAGAPNVVGPPVVLFPDPEVTSGNASATRGCLQSPYPADSDFTLTNVESTPSFFYVDVHTQNWPRGDVRAQLAGGTGDAGADDGAASGADERDDAMPAQGQGVAAGLGGATDDGRALPLTVAVLTLALAGAVTASSMVGRRDATDRTG